MSPIAKASTPPPSARVLAQFSATRPAVRRATFLKPVPSARAANGSAFESAPIPAPRVHPALSPRLRNLSGLLGVVARDLPPLEIDDLPAFLGRFREFCEIDANFYSDLAGQIAERGASASKLLEHHFRRFAFVVEQVQGGNVDPHLGVLYLQKILEENFYEKLPKRKVAVHRNRLHGWMIDNLRARGVEEEKALRFSMYQVLFYEESSGVLQDELNSYLLTQAHATKSDQYYGSDYQFFFPIELLHEIGFADQGGVKMKIYSRLTTFEETQRNLIASRWGFVVSPFSHPVVHFTPDRKRGLVPIALGGGKYKALREDLDPHINNTHDWFHLFILNIASPEIRQFIGRVALAFAEVFDREAEAFSAHIDLLQIWMELFEKWKSMPLEDYHVFLLRKITRIVAKFVSLQDPNDPRVADLIVDLGKDPVFRRHRQKKAPLAALMQDVLRRGASFAELNASVLRRPEVRRSLAEYGHTVSRQPEGYRLRNHGSALKLPRSKQL